MASTKDIIDEHNIQDEFTVIRQFEEFTAKFNKVYESDELKNYRYAVFASNMERAAKLTRASNGRTVHGVTKFSDLTQEEFAAQYLGNKPLFGQAAIDRVHNAKVLTPLGSAVNVTSWDWRTKGNVSPVKDQGQCGSCWAFSVTEEIESMYSLKHSTIPPILSPQQIVSCDSQDGGCNGGNTPTAYQYVESAGLEGEIDYPYTSGTTTQTGDCKYDGTKVQARITGFTYATPPCHLTCTKQDEDLLASNLMTQGPVSICVDATDGWQSYVSGVLTSSCPSGYFSQNHCVQLVGFNTDSTGNKYWIVRNSWSTSWGEGGYIYLPYGINACGLADEATIATVA
jgi:C1A family cysteine protease